VTNDLDEAIQVAQKVVLLTPSPGRIQRILDVSLSYPRDRTQDDFTLFRRKLFAEFHRVHQQAASADYTGNNFEGHSGGAGNIGVYRG